MSKQLPTKVFVPLDYEFHEEFKKMAGKRGYSVRCGQTMGKPTLTELRTELLTQSIREWMVDPKRIK